jgi:hypothetical protein
MGASGSQFVLLASLGDLVAARVIAARLENEGIEVRIHSEALGPYPVTVGRMAEARLLVPEDRLEEARMYMLEAEVDATFPPEDGSGTWSFEARLGALFLLLTILTLLALRAWQVF